MAEAVNDDLLAFLSYREEPAYTSGKPPQDVPMEMVASIATGLEEPLQIAKRYGFDEESFGALCQWEPFVNAVEAKKAEYAKNGVTYRLKSALMAENLTEHLYVLALANDTTFNQKLEAVKFLAKMGDLEPKQAQIAGAGEKFSIVINLPTIPGEKPVTLDLAEHKNEVPTLEIPLKDAETPPKSE